MPRRRTRQKPLIGKQILLTEEQIEFIYTHYESLSAGIRQMVADMMVKEQEQNIDEVKFAAVCQEYNKVIQEMFTYAAEDSGDLSRFVPTVAGFYERKWGVRPQDNDIHTLLSQKYHDLYEAE